MNCSNFRGIKLLSHTMKLWERIRDIVSISDGQFGFKPGVGTTDAIFVIRTLCEKYREGNKPLDIVFVDLNKAYDTVPREVLCRCMRKRNFPEGYNGLKINVAKTEHLSTREHPLPMKVNGEELKNVDHFKYLGSVIDRDGTIDRDVDLRVQAA